MFHIVEGVNTPFIVLVLLGKLTICLSKFSLFSENDTKIKDHLAMSFNLYTIIY